MSEKLSKKAASQLKCVNVTLDIWKWEGCVLTGGTSADFVAWAKRFIDADIVAGVGEAGRAYLEKGQPWLLWVESLSNIPTLAHECLHITAGILEARGLKFDVASEEAYTYTMEAIMRATLDAKRWELA